MRGKNMEFEKIKEFCKTHQWTCVLVVFGIILTILLLTIGFFKTLLLLVIVAICGFIGLKLDSNGVKIKDALGKIGKKEQ